jgi:coproporphyrinogen III oxidase-like Fe-S oxidoreductase
MADARARRFSPSFEEHLSREQAAGDRLIAGMRIRWGVELGRELEGRLSPLLDRFEKDGLIAREGGRVRPTARGFLFTDLLAREMIRAGRA